MPKLNIWPNIQARYSPVAPLPILRALQKKGALGDYLLLLAHDVLENPKGYKELVGELRQESEDSFIIMDNSLIELGSAMDTQLVVDAADTVDADVIMTPDALGGFEATKELVTSQSEALLHSGYPLMKVPQGGTIKELVDCVQWLRDIFPLYAGETHPEYWGIPRWIANHPVMKSRLVLTQFICMTSTTPRIHLLGMSENIEDDIRCAGLPDVMGIDSAGPLVFGFNGGLMGTDEWEHQPRGKLWERKRVVATVVDNIRWVRNAIEA